MLNGLMFSEGPYVLYIKTNSAWLSSVSVALKSVMSLWVVWEWMLSWGRSKGYNHIPPLLFFWTHILIYSGWLDVDYIPWYGPLQLRVTADYSLLDCCGGLYDSQCPICISFALVKFIFTSLLHVLFFFPKHPARHWSYTSLVSHLTYPSIFHSIRQAHHEPLVQYVAEAFSKPPG